MGCGLDELLELLSDLVLPLCWMSNRNLRRVMCFCLLFTRLRWSISGNLGMLRLIEGLDPSWIPSDVSALSEKGRKVAEGKRESVMKDLSWSFSSNFGVFLSFRYSHRLPSTLNRHGGCFELVISRRGPLRVLKLTRLSVLSVFYLCLVVLYISCRFYYTSVREIQRKVPHMSPSPHRLHTCKFQPTCGSPDQINPQESFIPLYLARNPTIR